MLVIGADLMTRAHQPDDRSTAALFGDGAGAAVVIAAPADGAIRPAVLGADARAGAALRSRIEHADRLIRMEGLETYRPRCAPPLGEATLDAVAAAGMTLADIDLFAYHQANSRILRAVGEQLEPRPGEGRRLHRRTTATRRPRRSRSRCARPSGRDGSSPARACCSARSARASRWGAMVVESREPTCLSAPHW